MTPGFHRGLHGARHAHRIFRMGDRGIEQHRIAAEFHRAAAIERPTAPGATLPSNAAAAMASSLAPLPVAAGRPEAADLWRLGSALYAATVALQPSRLAGLIRFAFQNGIAG